MDIALGATFTLTSIFSVIFIVQQYKRATPSQRPQIVWAAWGALATAAGACALYAFQ